MPEYRKKQSAITRSRWQSGKFDFLRKQEKRLCVRKDCSQSFDVAPSDLKKYCSSSCAASVSNAQRKISRSTKEKIAKSVRKAFSGRNHPLKGKQLVARKQAQCANELCGKIFKFERWKKRQFCSADCAIRAVGSRPTSPRAARAKAGVRKDLGDVYFFSRWEANYARALNLLGIKWVHQPKTFSLKTQKYTPDFYLPESDEYVEIKNFLSDYSRKRDSEFRELYPDLKLTLILKEDYLKLQDKLASKIKTWEYSR
ncbi:MAG: hypothetical protein R3B52_02015 [Candidatus Paceibacterota bacterium]